MATSRSKGGSSGGRRGGNRKSGGGSRSGSSSSSSSSSSSGSTSQTTTSHEQIRQWVESRGGRPACVRGTGGKDDVGMLRVDFPGYSGGQSLQEISWDDFFEKFDERGLVFLYQEETAGGERSNFNKLISGDGSGGGSEDSGDDSSGRSEDTAARGSATESSEVEEDDDEDEDEEDGTSTGSESDDDEDSGRKGHGSRHGRSAE